MESVKPSTGATQLVEQWNIVPPRRGRCPITTSLKPSSSSTTLPGNKFLFLQHETEAEPAGTSALRPLSLNASPGQQQTSEFIAVAKHPAQFRVEPNPQRQVKQTLRSSEKNSSTHAKGKAHATRPTTADPEVNSQQSPITQVMQSAEIIHTENGV